MEFLSGILSFVIGVGATYIIFDLLHKKNNISKTEFDKLQAQNNEINLKFTSQTISLQEKLNYNEHKINDLVSELKTEKMSAVVRQQELNQCQKTISELNTQNQFLEENTSKQNLIYTQCLEENKKSTQQITQLSIKISTLTAENQALEEKLNTQKVAIEELQKTAHLQFEKIANKLLQQESEKMTQTNKINLETILNPLKEDLHTFKQKIAHTHTEDTKQRTALEERIKGLIEQTNKISTEANNLASALKGKAQKRGNWGEMILERILESSGLTKDREYFIQASVKDEQGKNQRLDVKINLPDQRMIIIDSKVSLIAYDNYSATEDLQEQKKFLTEHLYATKLHIDQLSQKKYDNIDTSLDFTMMFIPIEPAYLLAIQGDSELWSYAYEKRILLLSPTTLIACLKLFSDLWRREWQNKNAMEIVKKGELLYEKFVGFTENFREIGKKIHATQTAYDQALGQLSTGRGNAISQAIQLKNLGLKSEKKISTDLLSVHEEEILVEIETQTVTA